MNKTSQVVAMDHIQSDVEALEAAYSDKISTMGFAIIQPDALIRGVHLQLIDLLSKRGVYICEFRYEHVEASTIEEMYKETIRVNHDLVLSWLQKLYGVGPALILMISGCRGEYPDLATFVARELKGSANPKKTVPGQIRFEFAALNEVLCLVHSSDDWKSSIREARLFFSKNEIGRAIEEAELVLSGKTPKAHTYVLKRQFLVTTSPFSQRCFIETILRIKTRLVGRVLWMLNEEIADHFIRILNRLKGPFEEKDIEILLKQERDLWLEVRHMSNSPSEELATACGLCLCDSISKSQREVTELLQWLRCINVVIDPAEALIVEIGFSCETPYSHYVGKNSGSSD